MKNEIKQKSFAQIHIIPFDIGYAFYDPLLMDNKKNLENAKEFMDKLKNYYANTSTQVINNYEIQMQNNIIKKFFCKKNNGADNALGIIKFAPNLSCYILTNGIGVFVIYDANNEALKNSNGIDNYSITLMAAYQKKITQATILNQYKGEHIFNEFEKQIHDFMNLCWKIIREDLHVSKNLIRKFSSNADYKSEGLSYVLTIHIFKNGTISKKEINQLMYSYLLSGIIEDKNWSGIEKQLIEEQEEYNEQKIVINNEKVYFAWSGVAIITNNFDESYEEMLNNKLISAVVKAEIYIQSRWFIADNSMDNINKNSYYSLENLQKIASMIEFSQAEIENEISANMDTLNRKVLEGVIQSSNVKKIYQSISSQINIQKNIKEAYYEDKKNRNRFIGNCFIAIFTACSLYEAVYELINNGMNLWTGILFATILFISIITVWIEYKSE